MKKRAFQRTEKDRLSGRARCHISVPLALLFVGLLAATMIVGRQRDASTGDFLNLLSQPQLASSDRRLAGRGVNPITEEILPSIESQYSKADKVHSLNEPTAHSLHPNWKLWHEMDEEQQEKALQEVAPYVKKYGAMIERRNFKLQIPEDQVCDLFVPGSDHRLCGPAPTKPCTFMSFGINDDPSYDIKLAEEWGCSGFAADPTIVHPSKLHPLVTFHNIGLTTLRPNEEKNIRADEEWWYTSMPALRKFLKLDRVNIMKIDCEGCEIALSRDILAEDPAFFNHIDQMTIETHVTGAWIETKEELYYFGLLFPLLEEAGFVMVSSMVFGCNIRHEKYGCMPELREWGFACGLGPHRKQAKSCHDFLFVKKELAYKNGTQSITR